MVNDLLLIKCSPKVCGDLDSRWGLIISTGKFGVLNECDPSDVLLTYVNFA